MNTLIHIILIAIVTAILSMIVKPYKSELAVCISIAGSVLILMVIIPLINDAFSTMKSVSSETGIDNGYVMLIIKVIAISYVTELGAGIARDAGEATLAAKVELGGKVVIFSLCVPILVSLIEMVTHMII